MFTLPITLPTAVSVTFYKHPVMLGCIGHCLLTYCIHIVNKEETFMSNKIT